MPPFSPSQGLASEPIAEAAFAIGRLSEAARRSPVAPAWRLREAATVAAEMAGRRLGPTRVQELFALVAGARGAYTEADEALHAALWFWRQGLRAWYGRTLPIPWGSGGERLEGERDGDEGGWGDAERATDWRDVGAAALHPEVAAALDRIGPLPASAGLVEQLRAVYLARSSDTGIGAFEVALPLVLRPVAGMVLPALATAAPTRRTAYEFDAWLARCAGRIEGAADASYGRLLALEGAWRRWHERVGTRRTSSELPAVLTLLAHTPLLTPSGVAASLGVVSKTGLRHLRALEDAGVVRELTGRARWRMFAAADIGLQPWAPRRIRRTEPLPINTEYEATAVEPLPPINFDEIDAMLRDAYRALDSAMRRVEARLAEAAQPSADTR